MQYAWYTLYTIIWCIPYSAHCTLYSLGLHKVNAPLYCRLQVYTVMVLLLPIISLPIIAPQLNNSQR